MTAQKRDNLIKHKARLGVWIDEINRVMREIAIKGTSSASISAGGGSKSYTRLDLGSLRALRSDYAGQVSQINRALAAGTPGLGRRIMTVRC